MIEVDRSDMLKAKGPEHLECPVGFFWEALHLDDPAVVFQKPIHAGEYREFVSLDIDLRNDSCVLHTKNVIQPNCLNSDGAGYGGGITVGIDAGASPIVICCNVEICGPLLAAYGPLNHLDFIKHAVYEEVGAELCRVEGVRLESDDSVEEACPLHRHRVKGSVRSDVKEDRRAFVGAGGSGKVDQKFHLLLLPRAIHQQPLVYGVALVDEEKESVAALHRKARAGPARISTQHACRQSVNSAKSVETLWNGSHRGSRWLVGAAA